MKKGVFLALLLMLLAAFPALAEDVYYADASQGGSVTSDKGYLSVSCPLDADSRVTMTIRDEWGSTVYQRDYGVCSGMFASEEVYLPQIGAQTTYRVTLSTDSGENSFTVIRVAPRLTDSNVTTAGLPLSDISGVSSPKKAILLDLSALNNQLPMVVPMVSGDVQLGCVTFTVRNGQLSVSAELTVDGTIDRAASPVHPAGLVAAAAIAPPSAPAHSPGSAARLPTGFRSRRNARNRPNPAGPSPTRHMCDRRPSPTTRMCRARTRSRAVPAIRSPVPYRRHHVSHHVSRRCPSRRRQRVPD